MNGHRHRPCSNPVCMRAWRAGRLRGVAAGAAPEERALAARQQADLFQALAEARADAVAPALRRRPAVHHRHRAGRVLRHIAAQPGWPSGAGRGMKEGRYSCGCQGRMRG